MAKRYDIDRIIVGNQLTIMRALQSLATPAHGRDLETRVRDIKRWWRTEFGEHVGFSTVLGDERE